MVNSAFIFKSRPGVALLDAIIAAVVLGIALATIIGLTGQALSSQAMGEQIQTAAMLADEQLNLVLARGPDNYAKSWPVSGPCPRRTADRSPPRVSILRPARRWPMSCRAASAPCSIWA